LAFLQATAQQTGARYVALAHSADDNVETVLHHLMRGTGPAGLTGIPAHRPLGDDLVLMRPLLSTCRERIREALQSIGQRWREDSSNDNTDYRRNWIRHDLIPLMTSQYPQVNQAITRAIEAQRQWHQTIERLAGDWLDRHWIGRDPVELSHDPQSDDSVVVAALQRLWSIQAWPRGAMSRQHWRQLTNSIRHADHNRYVLPSGIDVINTQQSVRIRPASGPVDPAAAGPRQT
jgi:tRNA(Ile)-lysidine synthase